MKKILLICVGIFLVGCIGLSILVYRPLQVVWSLAGFSSPKEYLVLFQNNTELRATGGFLGSYGRVRLDHGNVTLVKIEDIYTPDGQLDGHVDPPWPIQAAFGQGWWKLRDSNWDPDFPTSVKNMEWFFEHGKEAKADGMIAINLTFLERLLDITGPVYVVDEPEKITAQNFYKKTQTAVEQGFFPGSVQKKTFMSKLGSSVLSEVHRLSWMKKIRLPFLMMQLLREKQIFIFTNDQDAQKWLHDKSYDGAISDITQNPRDYFAMFESNLGANKANCCVTREVNMNLIQEKGFMTHDVRVHYVNTNPTLLKQPPQYWGGAYVNYVRVGIPLTANLLSLRVGDSEYPIPHAGAGAQKETVVDLMKEQTDEQLRALVSNDDPNHVRVDVIRREDKGIQFVGFFVVVDALGTKDVFLRYQTPIGYQTMSVQKQSGVSSFPLTFSFGQRTYKINVVSDITLSYFK